MGFDQYHEPPEELSPEARTFARMIASLTEEAEAIGWYGQRIALEADDEARDHEERPAGGVQALRHGPRVPAPPHAEVEGGDGEGPVHRRRHRRRRRRGRRGRRRGAR